MKKESKSESPLIEELADKAFEEARTGNINYWTIDKNDPEVKLWKEVWKKGFEEAASQGFHFKKFSRTALIGERSADHPIDYFDNEEGDYTVTLYGEPVAIATSKGYAQKLKNSFSVLVKESESFAIEFADYMRSECWEYDHKEQKTHSTSEHLAHFKQKYFPK